MAKLLTGTEADNPHIVITPAMKSMLAMYSDSTLYIARNSRFKPHVTQFQQWLSHKGYSYSPVHVEVAEINRCYEEAYGRSRREAMSNMQREAVRLFTEAARLGASDVHVRTHADSGQTRILMRVNDDLLYSTDASYDWGYALMSSIYQTLCHVSDPTFKPRERQDANITDRTRIPSSLSSLRVSTTPHADGNLMVLRLLYREVNRDYDLGKLGYSPCQTEQLRSMRRRPVGLSIVAGPTGSGKSTTLQRMLGLLYHETGRRKHLITVEDPPEYDIEGAVQTPVANAETEEERSRKFQLAIRSALRLDPNILMIGEMRDLPSANLAFEASMTGHQVFATLHANSAAATLDRLHNLGVEESLIFDHRIVTGLICQRLVKRNCPECRVPLTEASENYVSPTEYRRLQTVIDTHQAYVTGQGCGHCNHTGITGRHACAEIINTDAEFMRLYRLGYRDDAIRYWHEALRGQSMLEMAIDKVQRGEVDPMEAELAIDPLDLVLSQPGYHPESRQ